MRLKSSIADRYDRLSVGFPLALATFVGLQLIAAATCHSDDISNETTNQPAATRPANLLPHPIWVYNNWSAYDELSDRIPLTEDLAMKELQEVLRLRRAGVQFDYYVMDAFWFTPKGAYREWRKPNWPYGPDRWISECRRNGILPGLWFSTNTLVKLEAAPAWKNSLTENNEAMSLYEGGFLTDFMKTLDYWYDRGIRMFKFDFADFAAATPASERTQSPGEIRSRNETVLREALRNFRRKHADVVLEAFNGFGGDVDSTAGPFPFHNLIDPRWLEVFDAMYSGDPRPSDVPQMNFWRSVDIYADHMVRRYEQSSIPLQRIDSTAFMIGNTGTNYYRKTAGWKGMLLLMVARGGWINTIYGNLEFLNDADAQWFAKVQSIYGPLQASGQTTSFGGIPGNLEPYGFASSVPQGAVYAVVNPTQSVQKVDLPIVGQVISNGDGRVQFCDSGFEPVMDGHSITIGPGQLAVVGFGRYADQQFDLGIQDDVKIPVSITPLPTGFKSTDRNAIDATIQPPEKGDIRIVVQQRGQDGMIRRSWPGAPPDGSSLGTVLMLHASQQGKSLPIDSDYDRVIWSGLSWAVGEIHHGIFDALVPIDISCSSAERERVKLDASVFVVEFK